MPGPGPRGRWAPPQGRGWRAACLPRRTESGPAHSRQRPQGQEQARRNNISLPRTALTMSPKPQGCCFWRTRRQGLSQVQGRRPLSRAPHRGSPCAASAEVPAAPSSSRGLWSRTAGVKPQHNCLQLTGPWARHLRSPALLNVPICKMGK